MAWYTDEYDTVLWNTVHYSGITNFWYMYSVSDSYKPTNYVHILIKENSNSGTSFRTSRSDLFKQWQLLMHSERARDVPISHAPI